MSSSDRKSSSRARASDKTAQSSIELKLDSFVQTHEAVMWVVRVVLLVYASFVASNLPSNMTWLFDNTIARLVVVLLILGLAMCDPASAILLTIGFVLSIQAANKQHISKLANNVATSQTAETFMADVAASHASDMVASAAHGVKSAAHSVASTTSNIATGAAHAVQNATHSVRNGAAHLVQPQATHAQGKLFTTPQQMQNIQSNVVQDNQLTEVRTWQQELGPQGIGQPAGFNFDIATEASFSAVNPACARNQ
jgi:hypothetical protein